MNLVRKMISVCHIKSFSKGYKIFGKHPKAISTIGLAKDKLNRIRMINGIKHNICHNVQLSVDCWRITLFITQLVLNYPNKDSDRIRSGKLSLGDI